LIYFVATLIFLFFALSILCIFGIISGITGLKELDDLRHPHWGLSAHYLKHEYALRDRINSLAWSLAVNLFGLFFMSFTAYHLLKGPIS
jgi:hypothetical protein